MASSTVELFDVEARGILFPYWIQPSKQSRESLSVGDFAKLIFEPGERMWVKITEVVEGGYIGILDNDPVATFITNKVIRFEPRHVCDIIKESEK